MRVKVISGSDVQGLVEDIVLVPGSFKPSIAFVSFNATLSADKISNSLTSVLKCPLIGGSSCLGALQINGSHVSEHAQLAVLLIEDPEGHYGVGHQCYEAPDDAFQAAQDALDMALYSSGRGYESPAMIWCMLPPGDEEAILDGFATVVGESVAVFGGSSADDEINGDWQQLTDLRGGSQQICVAALYPSTPIGSFFSSAYEPGGKTFHVNQASDRTISLLDQQPAADVYNQATGNLLGEVSAGDNILSKTSLRPLGRMIKLPSGIDDYVLSHPCEISQHGGITLFSKVRKGETLYLMQGDRSSLLSSAKTVLDTAIDMLPEDKQAAGAILVYCAGCMLTIQSDLCDMTRELGNLFPETPILGFYTFGEQGYFLDKTNRHGNLMISAIVFSR